MSDVIWVQQANLHGELDSLKSIIEAMDAKLDEFEAFAAQHLAEWTGEAQASYASHKAQWDRQMAELGVVLASTPQTIAEIAEYHVQADRRSSTFYG